MDEIIRIESNNRRKFTNRLINESSPYLLQHAHNPVDWYPWSSEAFERAVLENKPVLISIGYSACHWCHVMEKESFEKEDIAEIMNSHFINIKVDREERPDIDHIYMDAIQAITGSGGWPLNVFLTPDKKPFYGGTYFPPVTVYNRPSWRDVLYSITEAWLQKRNEIEIQAEGLTQHLLDLNHFGNKSKSPGDFFSDEKINVAYQNIMNMADTRWGGFGKAPKFPQTFIIRFLIYYGYLTKKNPALDHALLTLDKIIQGGIYDHLGGGFARYSTDEEWLAPHFEKMLYDNSLLIEAISEAYQLTKNNDYKEVINETIEFIERDLLQTEGGFFSALDADSEGEEGKYYLWDKKEVDELLKEESDVFCKYYDITESGNWDNKNIIRIINPLQSYIKANQLNNSQLSTLLQNGKKILLQARMKRVPPQLDDKIILSWNALMNKACSKAYAATGNTRYLNLALKNMDFLLKSFISPDGLMFHTWKNGKASYPAFLDDYANLIDAQIELGQVSGDYSYFEKAKHLSEKVIKHFSDLNSPFFFYTNELQKDILLRKKEIYDGATPSGNAVMAKNLYRLAIIFNISSWREQVNKMFGSLEDMIIKYPTSFGSWLSLLFEILQGTNEIVIIGKDYKSYLVKILNLYIPFKLVMAAPESQNGFPMLSEKNSNDKNLIYLCKNYACQQPVTTIERLISLL